MPQPFLPFIKYNNEEEANDFIKILAEKNIVFKVDDSKNLFDVTFSSNSLLREIVIKIQPSDFDTANAALEAHYDVLTENIAKDYYLFDFSNEELHEILLKQDEWGHFDIQLSKKILRERGVNINEEIIKAAQSVRNKELSKSETISSLLLFWAYASVAFVGLLGIIVGLYLIRAKRALPNGTVIYKYDEKSRNHGTKILALSFIVIIVLLLAKVYVTFFAQETYE